MARHREAARLEHERDEVAARAVRRAAAERDAAAARAAALPRLLRAGARPVRAVALDGVLHSVAAALGRQGAAASSSRCDEEPQPLRRARARRRRGRGRGRLRAGVLDATARPAGPVLAEEAGQRVGRAACCGRRARGAIGDAEAPGVATALGRRGVHAPQAGLHPAPAGDDEKKQTRRCPAKRVHARAHGRASDHATSRHATRRAAAHLLDDDGDDRDDERALAHGTAAWSPLATWRHSFARRGALSRGARGRGRVDYSSGPRPLRAPQTTWMTTVSVASSTE